MMPIEGLTPQRIFLFDHERVRIGELLRTELSAEAP